VKKYKQGL